jgi:hypothetical protein
MISLVSKHGLALVMLAFISVAAHGQSRANRSKLPRAPTSSRENPCWSYPMTDEQQRTVNKLASDLIFIKRKRPPTQIQIDAISEDLAAVADSFVKDETDLIRNLAQYLAKALGHTSLPNRIKCQMADNLWEVLNMSRVGSSSLSNTASVCNTLELFHAPYSDMLDVKYYLNSLLIKAEKKGALKRN